MKNIYYVAGAVAIALAGLGIYSSQAQNSSNDNAADGVLIIEEEGYVVTPENSAATRPNPDGRMSAQDENRRLNNGNNRNGYRLNNSNINAAGNQNLQNNPGYNSAPDNAPVVDRAMKNQNPNYNNGMVIEEDVIETAQ